MEWKGEPLVLSSSRQPYEARIFKSLDGAIAELLRIGLTEASIKKGFALISAKSPKFTRRPLFTRDSAG